MTTIIKVTKSDNTTGYVSSTYPKIETTEREEQALRMDIQTTIAVAMTLGTMGIPHSMITRGEWEPIETKHRRLDYETVND